MVYEMTETVGCGKSGSFYEGKLDPSVIKRRIESVTRKSQREDPETQTEESSDTEDSCKREKLNDRTLTLGPLDTRHTGTP